MSFKAMHAMLTLVVGFAVGVMWLRAFWNHTSRVPPGILAAPIAAALLGLGHWVTYDFSLSHWAGDFSLFQAVFNTGVAVTLLARRRAAPARG